MYKIWWIFRESNTSIKIKYEITIYKVNFTWKQLGRKTTEISFLDNRFDDSITEWCGKCKLWFHGIFVKTLFSHKQYRYLYAPTYEKSRICYCFKYTMIWRIFPHNIHKTNCKYFLLPKQNPLLFLRHW